MSDISYELVRSRRKTIAIYIREDGSVEVRAPLRASAAAIDSFVCEKSDWIRRHSMQRAARDEEKRNFRLSYGDKLLYRGAEYPIAADSGRNAFFDGNAFVIPESAPEDRFTDILIDVYKILAKYHITGRVNYYAQLMGCTPAAVKISSANTRWGSCSGKDSINFSWKLIMADDRLIDYVVVHELAHTREHNHSSRFWQIVADVMPDHEQRRAELKVLSDRLSREKWD